MDNIITKINLKKITIITKRILTKKKFLFDTNTITPFNNNLKHL